MRQSRALLIAPALFIAVTVVAAALGWTFTYSRRGMYQYLPPEVLERPGEALASLHSQPPGFNALLAVGDRLGDAAPFAWWAFLTVATCAGLWLVGDVIRMLCGSVRMAVATACVAALLPSTLAYSSWLSYTQLVSVLLVAAVWGALRASVMGSVVSLLAITAAFLVRASITWIVVLAWVAFICARARSDRRRIVVLVSAAGCAALVLGLSLVRFEQFGTPTQSSWASQNYAKRLMYAFGYERLQPLVASDPCLRQLLDVGTFRPSSDYPACVVPASTRPELGPPTWPDGSVNLNDEGTLALSDQWTRFVATVVRSDPTLVLREVIPSRPGAPSALGQLMGPSADYPPLLTWRETAPDFIRGWVDVTAPVPWVALALWILGLCLPPRWGRRGMRDAAGYIAASVLLAYVLSTYLFLELGENQRFRAEADLLLLSLGAAGGVAGLRFLRSRGRARADA